MNYEKLYKEALERAKSIHNEHRAQCADIMTKVFPELAESEDEKIKKSLIEYINGIKSWNYFLGISKEQMITWIEKQGEQKPADKIEPKFRIGDVIEVKPMKCYGKIFTDKSNKIVDITEKSYILDDGKAYSIKLQDGWKFSEQKPAWNKEDEEMLESIITYADKDFFIHKEQINWLKSLRPQNKWKPSEEQLNAFEHFVRSIGESGYASPYDNNTKLLYSLLNDLKNL